MSLHNQVHDGPPPGTVGKKTLAGTLSRNEPDGPVVSAAKSLTTAYRRSSERISEVRDHAVEAGKQNPVVTGLSVLVAGFGCGIGCGILFSNWLSSRRTHKNTRAANQKSPLEA